jgi:hypothetical protein
LVGLVYDPFTDILSASTRNGATLDLKVGVLGVFSKRKYSVRTAIKIMDHKISDFGKTNLKLFYMYENIFLNSGMGSE